MRLEVTVVFSENNLHSFVVSDGVEACFCSLDPVVLGLEEPPRPGDRLELEAQVEDGVLMPRLRATRARRIASQGIPEPRKMGVQELMKPGSAGCWVEVEGRVTQAQRTRQTLMLFLNIDGRNLRAQLPIQKNPSYPMPWNLIETRVRVRCVLGTRCNLDGQMTERYLKIPSSADIQPLEGPVLIGELPVLNATELLRYESELDQPVRLQGEVLHWRPGDFFYLRTSKGCLRVRTPQPLNLKPGQLVDVVGYPNPEVFRPSLRAMKVEPLGKGRTPEPVVFATWKSSDYRPHMDLISLEAELLSVTRLGEVLRLQCRMGKGLIEAILTGADLPEEWLTPGAILGLKGICELVTLQPPSNPPTMDRMRLHLGSARDLALVKGAPWYRSRNLLVFFWVALGGALAAFLWALSLRKRVAAQTAMIREQLKRSVILEERERIARDWHDTTDQQLTGAGLLLDHVASWAGGSALVPAFIGEHLGVARQILQTCRRESRATIRDLHSLTLQENGIQAALEEMLLPLASGANLELRIEVESGPPTLSIGDEHHLLRIANEAVSNAVRHSGASRITVRLIRQPLFARLEVVDNGKGFDRATQANQVGHFGLRTMEQRARKLGGKFDIQNAPEGGTIVSVNVPSKTSPE